MYCYRCDYAVRRHILTSLERKRIEKYLKADGEKDVNIRQLVRGYRLHVARLKEDLALLEKLLTHYQQH